MIHPAAHEAGPLNIAIVGAFDECIPRPGDASLRYGGIERVLSGLVDKLIGQGHAVTLFAAAGSGVPEGGTLFECTPMAVRHMKEAGDDEARLALSMEGLLCAMKHIRHKERASDPFDIVHFNYGPEWLPLLMRDAAEIKTPCVTTFHGPLTQLAHQAVLAAHYRKEPVISISNDQREPIPNLNYVATVYNGVDTERLKPTGRPRGDYLAFVGSLSPVKGVDDAIMIAAETGRPLRMGAKLDPNPRDQAYYRDRIRPLIRRYKGLVTEEGEVNDPQKRDLVGDAHALVVPFARNRREPFGLVSAEAGSLGTAVVSRPHGGTGEIVVHKKTGLLYMDRRTMARSINRGDVSAIQSSDCRERVERLFSYETMAIGYAAAYRQVIAGHRQ